MARAKVGPLDMYYELRGQGEPLVMIMGLSATADWWDPPVVDELAKSFRLLMFDNRDAGRTTGLDCAYSIRDMADDTAGLMDHVGIKRAHVMGLSMGGMIAQEFVLSYPERVDRLILGCTTPGRRGVQPPPEVMAGMMTPDVDVLMAALPAVLYTPEWVEAHPVELKAAMPRLTAHPPTIEGFRRQLQAIVGFDTLDRLGAINAPTLVLHGDRDILVPPENGCTLADRIAGAGMVTFPGCAHGFNATLPDLFLATVRGFLTQGRQGQSAAEAG